MQCKPFYMLAVAKNGGFENLNRRREPIADENQMPTAALRHNFRSLARRQTTRTIKQQSNFHAVYLRVDETKLVFRARLEAASMNSNHKRH
jgi:hypothetical protein